MKLTKNVLLTGGLLLATSPLFAADLLEVYQDALKNDPTYLSEVSTYKSALQNVPIGRAALLPQVALSEGTIGSGFLRSVNQSGDRATSDYSSRGYGVTLSVQQPLFNYSAWQTFKEAQDSERASAATYYSAQQDLMVRAATAYFTILKDQEMVRYTEENVKANKSSLDQAKQQYEVGVKTQIDVYSAKAAYSSAISQDVIAKNTLANDIENLRAITNHTYKTYQPLASKFPMVKPDPQSIDQWVAVAVEHNWALKSQHETAMAAEKNIKAQFGQHYPVVNLTGSYSHNLTNNDYDNSAETSGDLKTNSYSAIVDVEMPLFTGGLISAEGKQADADYQTALQNLELQYRTTVSGTRQDYLGVISSISALHADQTSVESNESALKGYEEGYKVGTQTMTDVLTQQGSLFSSQQDLATDEYNYIVDLVNLKYDAGVLSEEDMAALNKWLVVVKKNEEVVAEKAKPHQLQALSAQYIPQDPTVSETSE